MGKIKRADILIQPLCFSVITFITFSQRHGLTYSIKSSENYLLELYTLLYSLFLLIFAISQNTAGRYCPKQCAFYSSVSTEALSLPPVNNFIKIKPQLENEDSFTSKSPRLIGVSYLILIGRM